MGSFEELLRQLILSSMWLVFAKPAFLPGVGQSSAAAAYRFALAADGGGGESTAWELDQREAGSYLSKPPNPAVRVDRILGRR